MDKKVTFNSKSSIIAEEVGNKSNGETQKDKTKKTSVVDMENSMVKKAANRTKESKAKEESGKEKCSRKIYVDEFDLDNVSYQRDKREQNKYTFKLFS